MHLPASVQICSTFASPFFFLIESVFLSHLLPPVYAPAREIQSSLNEFEHLKRKMNERELAKHCEEQLRRSRLDESHPPWFWKSFRRIAGVGGF